MNKIIQDLDLDINWLLSLPKPIIVGARVADYLKTHFPDLEIVDCHEHFKHQGKDNNIYVNNNFDNGIYGEPLIYTTVLEDLKRGILNNE